MNEQVKAQELGRTNLDEVALDVLAKQSEHHALRILGVNDLCGQRVTSDGDYEWRFKRVTHPVGKDGVADRVRECGRGVGEAPVLLW